MLRGRALLRRGFFAAPVERFAAGLRAAVDRLAPVPDDLARVDVDFFAALRFAVERFAVDRLAVERFAEDLRVPERFAPALRDDAAELPLVPSSIAHLPDITRCAASATASAMSEPSFVALAIMLLAACEAVSAASRPASRIARLAFGLVLIAAAAAASPAASISLLIAALASLSTVSLPEEVLEDPFRADFAMAVISLRSRKDTSSK